MGKAQQRAAAKRGEHGQASHYSKVNTKECRYSVPVDALKKGFAQKVALEKYRAQVIMKAKEAGQPAVVEAVGEMCILALRQRALDKDPDVADSMMLPLWPRSVSNEAAKVGNLAATFLSDQSKIIRSYIGGKPELIGGTKAAIGSPGVLRADAPLEGEALKEQLALCDKAKVVTSIAQFLKMPNSVCKLTQLKMQCAGIDSQVAFSLLVELGAVKKVFWKAEGQTGYAAAYILKQVLFESAISELKFANVIRDMADVLMVDYLVGKLPMDLQPVMNVHGASFPSIKADGVEAFAAAWLPLLKPADSSGVANGDESKMTKTTRGASLTPEMIASIKSHFKWILGNTGLKEIAMTYLKKKVDGFDSDNHWEIVASLFSALGLASESKSKKQSFELLRPVGDEDLKAAAVELQAFFELDEKQFKVLDAKLRYSTQNPNFTMSTFRETLESLVVRPAST